jgi:hypothetical protein
MPLVPGRKPGLTAAMACQNDMLGNRARGFCSIGLLVKCRNVLEVKGLGWVSYRLARRLHILAAKHWRLPFLGGVCFLNPAPWPAMPTKLRNTYLYSSRQQEDFTRGKTVGL